MPKRLAITVAGAVSLGSYEAGVLYEIIRAIGQHNADPATTDADRIEIDVLTGASAGGMTAVIATQKLLYDAGALTNSEDNAFYNPWVADISLASLLNLAPEEDATHSIFSSNLIEALARKYITRRYASAAPPARQRHPAAASKIRLGLALSNLNGVAYSYPLRANAQKTGDTFGYTRFQDEMTGRFAADGSNDSDTLNAWEPWRNAAVSCGAFPIAFRVKELHRFQSEYTRHHLDEWTPPPARDFAYTDGGVFQNEPLGLAKNLVDEIDGHQDTASRFYLYVAPGAKTSDVNTKFKTADANFLATAQALVGAVLHQAKFQDWINAEEINDQIDVFNRRALQLYHALLDSPAPSATALATALQPAADALLPGLFVHQSTLDTDTYGKAVARLRQQFDKECAELASQRGEATVKTWLDSIVVLETAAGLNLKDEMTIYGITATNQELAGGGLFAFEGFFAQALRQHDYNLGRQKARKFLAQHRQPVPPRAAGQPEPLPDIGPIRYDPTDNIPDIKVPARDPATGDVLISQLDEDIRRELFDTVNARAEAVLVELKVPWELRAPIRWFFIQPQLKKRLGL